MTHVINFVSHVIELAVALVSVFFERLCITGARLGCYFNVVFYIGRIPATQYLTDWIVGLSFFLNIG